MFRIHFFKERILIYSFIMKIHSVTFVVKFEAVSLFIFKFICSKIYSLWYPVPCALTIAQSCIHHHNQEQFLRLQKSPHTAPCSHTARASFKLWANLDPFFILMALLLPECHKMELKYIQPLESGKSSFLACLSFTEFICVFQGINGGFIQLL